jgi:SAM-dependent methyltransferase
MPSSAPAAGFAKRVAEYVAGRPDYPPALLDALPRAATVVELGAGTGKFTQSLVGRARRIVAVEALPEMAARIGQGGGSGVEVLIAKAEQVPLPDACADLVCCATAFHWFDYPAAADEIHRLLKPGGHLALIWNRRDDRVPWVAAYSALVESYARDARSFGSGHWREIFKDNRFAKAGERSFPFTYPMPVTGIADRALSTSYIAQLPEGEQAALRARIDDLIAAHAELRDATEIAFPYVSLLYLLRRV